MVCRCSLCGTYSATLVARRDLDARDEVTVYSNPSPEWEDASWPFEVTFDGGARMVGDSRVAGAGATLWRHHLAGGPPTLLASTVVAIPWDAGSQVAEAIGCRAAINLLLALDTGDRRARVVGDNLAVVRYGASSARLRRVDMQAHLEAALGDALGQGWLLTWQAVRRRLNHSADALATRGVMWAAQRRDQGLFALATY